MDFTTQLRRTYLGAAPHTFYTALIWLVGGIVGEFISTGWGILVFIIGASFTFPAGELIRRAMRVPNLMSKENQLGKLFTLSAFGIPLCYPLIYLVCKSNVNYFFPAFSILIGAHYLIFIYGYGMLTFGILSLLLVAQGTITSMYYQDQFAMSAYLTSLTLFVFGILHFKQVKKETHE
jgi:hypothetical protein